MDCRSKDTTHDGSVLCFARDLRSGDHPEGRFELGGQYACSEHWTAAAAQEVEYMAEGRGLVAQDFECWALSRCMA